MTEVLRTMSSTPRRSNPFKEARFYVIQVLGWGAMLFGAINGSVGLVSELVYGPHWVVPYQLISLYIACGVIAANLSGLVRLVQLERALRRRDRQLRQKLGADLDQLLSIRHPREV